MRGCYPPTNNWRLHTALPIPLNDLGRAALADEEVVEAVGRVIRSGWYLLGAETESFEYELADYLGVLHTVGVANGTDALQLAFTAVGGKAGDEIVMAANAGGYGALAARRCGLGVRFADVEDSDLLLSRRTIEQALTPHTSMVLVTHLYGKLAPIADICDLCHASGIAVVEDCAQAAGANADNRYAGSFGDAAAFSFYPTKNLGAIGDGGAVVTSNEDIAARLRRLRQYGWGEKYRVQDDGGQNSRLDEIQAAVLRVRLRRLDEANCRRRAIAHCYGEALSPSQAQMAQSGGEDYVAHLAVVRSLQRDAFVEGLSERGVDSAIHYPLPDHRQKFIGLSSAVLPTTEAAAEQVLSLPCFPELEDHEVDLICAALREVAGLG